MTTQQITVDSDIAPPFVAVAASYAGLKTALGLDTTELAADVVQAAADAATIAALKAQIAVLQPIPPVGCAANTQAVMDELFGANKAQVARSYNTPGAIPAKFAPQLVSTAMRVYLESIKPDHPVLDQGAAVLTYVDSGLAYGAAHDFEYVTIIEHEPENSQKQPQDDPANYAAEWVFYAQGIWKTNPGAQIWATFMTYTLDSRPGYKGTNPWIVALNAACNAAGIMPSGISFDGYTQGTKTGAVAGTAAANFGPDFAYVRAQPGWEAMPLAVAEWGVTAEAGGPDGGLPATDAAIADHITTGLAYFKAQDVKYVSWFNDASYGYTLDTVKFPLSCAALVAGLAP
jgi:hypothetical protein